MSIVSPRTQFRTVSFTRPSDTTQYAAGDVVGTAATNPLKFTDASRAKVNSGAVVSATLISSANQATKGDFDLMLFDTHLTADADNATFTPTDAELATCVGIVSFIGTTAKLGNITSGAGGNLIYPNPVIMPIGYSIVNTAGVESDCLWGVLVARSTYTPVSAEVFYIRLGLVVD